MGPLIPIAATVIGGILSSIHGKGQSAPSWEEIQAHGLPPSFFAGLTPDAIAQVGQAFGIDPATILRTGVQPDAIRASGITPEMVQKSYQGLSAGSLADNFGTKPLAADTQAIFQALASSPAFAEQLNQASNQGATLAQALRTRLAAAGDGATSGIGTVAGAIGNQLASQGRSAALSSLWRPAFDAAGTNLGNRLSAYTTGVTGAADMLGRGTLATQDALVRSGMNTQDILARIGQNNLDTWMKGKAFQADQGLNNQKIWSGFREAKMNQPTWYQNLGNAAMQAGAYGMTKAKWG